MDSLGADKFGSLDVGELGGNPKRNKNAFGSKGDFM
jgi:hypothetical protein